MPKKEKTTTCQKRCRGAITILISPAGICIKDVVHGRISRNTYLIASSFKSDSSDVAGFFAKVGVAHLIIALLTAPYSALVVLVHTTPNVVLEA